MFNLADAWIATIIAWAVVTATREYLDYKRNKDKR